MRRKFSWGIRNLFFALLSLPSARLQVMRYAQHGCPFISLHSISFAAASGRVCVVCNYLVSMQELLQLLVAA